jgi:hypothetical protein
MKTVFVGPTLPDAAALTGGPLDIRPPAAQGDILTAVRQGATAIGLIDGYFEYAAPVWHKEILFALSNGIPVFGAASMGALRAAECAAFGMTGIGRIYAMYASGELEDDDAVAQLHAPGELGYRALSEPLVNVMSTLGDMMVRGIIDEAEQQALLAASRAIFFKKRTWRSILDGAALPAARRTDLRQWVGGNAINQKRCDAEELIAMLSAFKPGTTPLARDWTFARTSLWNALEKGME